MAKHKDKKDLIDKAAHDLTEKIVHHSSKATPALKNPKAHASHPKKQGKE